MKTPSTSHFPFLLQVSFFLFSHCRLVRSTRQRWWPPTASKCCCNVKVLLQTELVPSDSKSKYPREGPHWPCEARCTPCRGSLVQEGSSWGAGKNPGERGSVPARQSQPLFRAGIWPYGLLQRPGLCWPHHPSTLGCQVSRRGSDHTVSFTPLEAHGKGDNSSNNNSCIYCAPAVCQAWAVLCANFYLIPTATVLFLSILKIRMQRLGKVRNPRSCGSQVHIVYHQVLLPPPMGLGPSRGDRKISLDQGIVLLCGFTGITARA